MILYEMFKNALYALFPLWLGTAEERGRRELAKAKARQITHEAKAKRHGDLARFYRTSVMRLNVYEQPVHSTRSTPATVEESVPAAEKTSTSKSTRKAPVRLASARGN